MPSLEEILIKHTKQWISLPGVVGTAIGLHNNKTCIKILVDKVTTELLNTIPMEVEGFPVIIERTGAFRAT